MTVGVPTLAGGPIVTGDKYVHIAKAALLRLTTSSFKSKAELPVAKQKIKFLHYVCACVCIMNRILSLTYQCNIFSVIRVAILSITRVVPVV